MKCYQAKAGELSKQWFVLDASEQVVGRLAAQIAPILMGKHRPTYTPHIDTGDYVIVTNVDKVVFTGNKWRQKSYQRYSGYPGGQRDEAAWKLFERRPERILELAIQRMMPKSKLGRHMMDKLKLYVGGDHPHQAQCPIPLEALSGRPASSGALFKPEPTAKATATATKPLPIASTSEIQPAAAVAPLASVPVIQSDHTESSEAQPQATTGDEPETTSAGEATES
jgi:large subunit ribosomal protein L13